MVSAEIFSLALMEKLIFPSESRHLYVTGTCIMTVCRKGAVSFSQHCWL